MQDNTCALIFLLALVILFLIYQGMLYKGGGRRPPPPPPPLTSITPSALQQVPYSVWPDTWPANAPPPPPPQPPTNPTPQQIQFHKKRLAQYNADLTKFITRHGL